MPPLPADFIHARACKLKCEKILTRPPFEQYLRYWLHEFSIVTEKELRPKLRRSSVTIYPEIPC